MNHFRIVSWVVLLASLFLVPRVADAEPVPLDKLDHIHGLTIDPDDSSRLLLATHYGMFSATPDGRAVKISDLTADFMSFAASPGDPRKFYVSGRQRAGVDLGVMMSEDAGRTWRQISKGGDDPVGFRALTVSPVDASLLYGLFEGLHESRDGGLTWERVGDVPPDTFRLAASAIDAKTLYAATLKGLQRSADGGRNWQSAYRSGHPATSVHVTPEGAVYAYVYGTGLVTAQEPELSWRTVASDFQDRLVIGITSDPKNPNRLFGTANTGAIMVSKDTGKSWYSFEGNEKNSTAAIQSGRRLYAENCRACHGEGGQGERPDDPYAQDEFGFVAPPLNNDAHGWHHSDRQIAEIILNGSPRNERMVAWKDALSREDAENIVIYIKSLWNFRSLACQGARHLACMQ